MTEWSESTSDEIPSNLKNEIDIVYVHSDGNPKLIGEWKLINDNNYNQIIIHPDAYKKLMGASDTSFLGKLKYGWRLFALSWSDWKDVMYSEDFVEEFFEYLGNCGEL
jgi:hypothetical protein